MHSLLPRSLVLTICLACGFGCTHQVRPSDTGPVPESEADSRSGADGVAQGALAMQDESIEDSPFPVRVYESRGDVSWPARQRTRWRIVQFRDEPLDADTPLRCELSYRPESASLRLDAFAESGALLPEHHEISPGHYVSEVFLDKQVPVLVRIRAERPQDAASFTLRCGLHYRDQPEYRGHHGYRRGFRPEPEDPYAKALEGRIVSFEKKGGMLLVLLDKGSNAGIKVGQHGAVLEGKSGREPLEGGDFQVREVTESTCVVEARVRSLGKNRRVVFFDK